MNLVFAAGSPENVTDPGLSNGCCSLTLSRTAAAAEMAALSEAGTLVEAH